MTRFIFALCLFLSSLIISHTLWATTLSVSDNLIVSQINNKMVEHGFIGTKSDFSLESGQYALIIHYNDVFEDLNIAEHRVVKSKEFVVKFTVKNEKSLHLGTESIKNLAQAETFSKSPTLILKDEKNRELILELESVDEYKIAEQVELAINTYTSQQDLTNSKPLPAKVETVKTTPVLIKPEQALNNNLIQINALPMLKYWWQNASEEEKKNFKKYISTH